LFSPRLLGGVWVVFFLGGAQFGLLGPAMGGFFWPPPPPPPPWPDRPLAPPPRERYRTAGGCGGYACWEGCASVNTTFTTIQIGIYGERR
jgi:hypothetical protein